VEFIEQGLSIIHTQALQLKDDFTQLAHQMPEQAKELKQTSALLRGSSHKSDSDINYNLLAQKRQEQIQSICENKGFEDFLLPLKYHKLCLAAHNGPVILLNKIESESVAVIILSPLSPVLHLPLPQMAALSMKGYVKRLKNALHNFSIHSHESCYGKQFQANNFDLNGPLEEIKS
jgi:hypothetical protein